MSEPLFRLADLYRAYATGAASANKRDPLSEDMIHKAADAYVKLQLATRAARGGIRFGNRCKGHYPNGFPCRSKARDEFDGYCGEVHQSATLTRKGVG